MLSGWLTLPSGSALTFHISIDFTLWVDHAQGKENNSETMGLARQKQYGLLATLSSQ